MRDGPNLVKAKPDWQIDAGSETAAQDSADDHVFPSTRGVLTAAEIEALLRPNIQTAALEPPTEITPRETPNFEIDPAQSDLVHSEQNRILGARLSRALGTGAGMKAAVIATQAATIPSADLPALLNGKSSAIACVGPTDADIHALICLPPMLADAIIAKACGARGSTGRIGDGWTLSAIDCALLEQLLVPIGGSIGAGLSLQSIEAAIPYVSRLLAARNVTVTEFSVEAPGLHSDLAVIQSDELPQKPSPSSSETAALPVTALVTARLARLSVPLSRLTELKAGSTLLLGLPADQPVELLSGDRSGEPAFEGRMGRKGNQVAVKLTKRVGPYRTD